MRDGALVQHGVPTDLWYHPVDAFVAEFLGHPNIWIGPDGTVVAPIPSLVITDSAALPVVERVTVAECAVVDVSFREGRWRLLLDEQSDTHRRITVDSDVPHTIGERVFVRIEHDELHTLTD